MEAGVGTAPTLKPRSFSSCSGLSVSGYSPLIVPVRFAILSRSSRRRAAQQVRTRPQPGPAQVSCVSWRPLTGAQPQGPWPSVLLLQQCGTSARSCSRHHSM